MGRRKRRTDRGASSAVDPRDSATPPPLRYREGSAAEHHAAQDLNSRHPAADTARHPKDYVEPPTPNTTTRPVSGATEGTDILKDSKIDEMRVMLSRASSMGKRTKSQTSPHDAAASRERLPNTGHSEKTDYDPYAYYTQQSSPPSARSDRAYEIGGRTHPALDRDHAWPQPPTSTFRPPPTISEQHSYHSPTSSPPLSTPGQRRNLDDHHHHSNRRPHAHPRKNLATGPRIKATPPTQPHHLPPHNTTHTNNSKINNNVPFAGSDPALGARPLPRAQPFPN